MTRFFTIFAILCATSVAQSQSVIFRSDSIKGVEEFRTLASGDSALFLYQEKIGSRTVYRGTWISETGTSSVKLYHNTADVASFGDNLYYYYLEEENNRLQLRASIQRKGTKTMEESRQFVVLDGILIGTYFKENLKLITVDQKTDRVIVTQVTGLDVVSSIAFQMPFRIVGNVPDDGFTTMRRNSALGTFRSYQSFKVIVDSTLNIVCDIHNKVLRTFETKTVKLNLTTGKTEVKTVSASQNISFSSYYLDGKVFRVNRLPKELSLSVYDLKAKSVLSRKTMTKTDGNFGAYVRVGRSNFIAENLQAADVIRIPAMIATLNVAATDSGTYIMQIGTYYDENRGLISMTNPLAALISMAYTVVNNMRPGPGIHRYFYLNWDPVKNSFTPVGSDAELLRMKIDNYEIAELKGEGKIEFKDYIDFKKGILATYYDGKKDEARLIYFE